MSDRSPDETRGTPSPIPNGARSVPQVANHEILRRIGSGSFGEVWLARNIMGTYRAVKIVYRNTFSDERPYLREFRGLVKFEPVSRSHDGFIDILEAGRDDARGYFYYVMEAADDVMTGDQINPLVYEPKTLGAAIHRQGWLPVDGCISLGVSLSAALMHLHCHGLIHRDIKPSNIIFVNGIPKIADIGLVVAAEGDPTLPGGTPGYFPNEAPGTLQADIYAIGKVLYEASTGQDRMQFPTLPASWDKMHDPARAAELNMIFCKACESDHRFRYRTANELHGELLLLLAGKSVRRIRFLEKLVPRLLRIGLAVFAALLVLSIVAYQTYKERKTRGELDLQKVGRAVAQGNFLVETGDLLGALPHFVEALGLQENDPVHAPAHRLRIGSVLAQCPKLVGMGFVDGTINAADVSADGSVAITAGKDGGATICDMTSGATNVLWQTQQMEVESVALSRDQTRVAVAGNHLAEIWDLQTHEQLCVVNPTDTVYSIQFNSDATQFVTASGRDDDGHVAVWETATGRLVWEIQSRHGAFRCASFSPDDGRLLVICEDGIARIWDLNTCSTIGLPIRLHGWGRYAAWSPDGRRVVTSAEDANVLISDAQTGLPLVRLKHPIVIVRMARFSPDGRYVITAGWDSIVRVWDAFTGDLIMSPIRETGAQVMHASFSADGRCIRTVNGNGVLSAWDLAPIAWAPPKEFLVPSQSGKRWLFLDGQAVTLFQGEKPRPVALTLPTGFPEAGDARLNEDGDRVVLFSGPLPTNAPVQCVCWDLRAGWVLSQPLNLGPNVQDAFLSRDGHWLATLAGRDAMVWDLTTGARVSQFAHTNNVSSGCFSPDAHSLATASGNRLTVWDIAGHTNLISDAHENMLSRVAFSPDGRWLVACYTSLGYLGECDAVVYDVAARQVRFKIHHRDGVLAADFSSDSRSVVTASEDTTAQLWDVEKRVPRFKTPLQHVSQVKDARFSPDNRWLVTACDWGRSAQLWDAETAEALTPRFRHPWGLLRAQFVDGNRALITRESHNKHPGLSAYWKLPSDERSTEYLTRLARLLSGSPAGEASSTNIVNDCRDLWQRLRAKFPEDFKVTPEQVVQWEVRQAELSEKANLWPIALEHWSRVVRARPDNLTYRRGEDFAMEVLSFQ